jgi:hypothetical protein
MNPFNDHKTRHARLRRRRRFKLNISPAWILLVIIGGFILLTV